MSFFEAYFSTIPTPFPPKNVLQFSGFFKDFFQMSERLNSAGFLSLDIWGHQEKFCFFCRKHFSFKKTSAINFEGKNDPIWIGFESYCIPVFIALPLFSDSTKWVIIYFWHLKDFSIAAPKSEMIKHGKEDENNDNVVLSSRTT